MCHFITLTVPTDDTTALAAVMRRHDRIAQAVDNPLLAKVLRPGEQQYIMARSCDCGTVLGQQPDETAIATKTTNEADRLRRKGWSEARITRALTDKARAEGRPRRPGPDSLDKRAEILADLKSDLRLPHAGLFVHFYSGGISTEDLTPTRRDIRKGEDLRTALATMAEDELTVFRLQA